MGSAVSLAVGLIGTWIVILLLPQQAARFAPEQVPLLQAIALFTGLAATSAASFYGELRNRTWRLAAHGLCVALLSLTVWIYWPK